MEDEKSIRAELVRLLTQYADQHEDTFQLTEYPDGADLLESYHGQHDILFLDIQMPGLDGMTAAGEIRKMDPNVQIIFVTNLARRAPDGYEVEAAGFLVKPVNSVALFRCMDRILKLIERRKDGYLVLQNTRELQRISLKSIHYIESKGHYIKVHTDLGAPVVLSSMKAVEQQLEGQSFFRCSSSCIISLERVRSISQNTIVVEGTELTVSCSRKKELMDALNRCYSGF